MSSINFKYEKPLILLQKRSLILEGFDRKSSREEVFKLSLGKWAENLEKYCEKLKEQNLRNKLSEFYYEAGVEGLRNLCEVFELDPNSEDDPMYTVVNDERIESLKQCSDELEEKYFSCPDDIERAKIIHQLAYLIILKDGREGFQDIVRVLEQDFKDSGRSLSFDEFQSNVIARLIFHELNNM